MNYLREGATLQNGKYCIIKSLGSGGFGITYLATQVSLGRKVAIKEFFMMDYCDRDSTTSHVSIPAENSRRLVESYKQKFVKEAQMIASLNNPHVVKIYDIFEDNGTAYYVMEYLSRGSLLDIVKNTGRLTERKAVSYVEQVGQALSYIHRKNILHLDIKPSNILLNEDGEAVIIDFGISKHFTDEGGQTSTTPVGISKGFAPLEQYQQGSVERFTPATDIYSLGATLYYLLTGVTPPEAAEIYEEGLPDIPEYVKGDLLHAIKAAMEPKRKNRPQNVGAFLSLLGCSAPFKQPDTINSLNHSSNRLPQDGTDDGEETIIISTDGSIDESDSLNNPADNHNSTGKKNNRLLLCLVLAFLAVGLLIPWESIFEGHDKEDSILIDGSKDRRVTFSDEGGRMQYDLSKSFKEPLDYYPTPDWCTIHTGSSSFTVICQENKASQERTVTLGLRKKGTSNNLASLTISQDARKPANIVASSLNMQSSGYVEAKVGDLFYLDYSITPNEAKNHKVSWSSSNTNVATINSSGAIVAKGNGKTTITASVDQISAKCLLEVRIINMQQLSSSSNATSSESSAATHKDTPKEISIKINQIRQLNVDGQTVNEWKSYNTTVVYVSKSGIITGTGEGKTTVRAFLNNGGTQSFIVTVEPSSDSSSQTNTLQSNTNYNASIKINQVYQLKATGKTFTKWSADDSSIVYVGKDGKVTGLAVGKTIVRGFLSNGGVQTWTIIVNPANSSESSRDGYVEVYGTVRTSPGQTVLFGARVTANETNEYVSTDSYGQYRITVKKGTVLKYSYYGYLTETYIINKSGEVNVVLKKE